MAAGEARPYRERVTTESVGSGAWLDSVFQARAKRELFADHTPDQAAPVLVLLGGQPAAGKTRAQRAILSEHAADDLVEITGDDLREYHPDYSRLADHAPFEMPGSTAPVSGGLVARALDHALQHRYSVLCEGTFRDPRMVTEMATRFADAGYRVDVVAVATPAPVSRLSAEMRSNGFRRSRACRCSLARARCMRTPAQRPVNGHNLRRRSARSGLSSTAALMTVKPPVGCLTTPQHSARPQPGPAISVRRPHRLISGCKTMRSA